MSRECTFCGKTPVSGNKISHSNIKTKKRHMPNLQKVRVYLNGLAQKAYACTRCIRSGFVLKPPVRVYSGINSETSLKTETTSAH